MNEQSWQANNSHPALATLLLHVDGELDRRECAMVVQHLKDCWACRTRCEQLQQTIYSLVQYHQEVLLPSLSPPPLNRHRFSRRLAAEARQKQSGHGAGRILRCISDAIPRPAWIAVGAMVALLFSMFLLPVAQAPSAAAAQLLDRARRSERELSVSRPGRILYQKIRIRRGASLIERTVYHGNVRRDKADGRSPDAETEKAFKAANIDWHDPLNADDFSAWRDSQPRKRDLVVESPTSATLITTPSVSGYVVSASLTVQHSDWRPIARRVEFQSGPPVEITETSFEVREIPVLVARNETTPVSPRHGLAVNEPKLSPSLADLEESELRLREAFHAIEADVREAPEIWRANGEVRFRMFPDSAERKQEINRMVEGIPLVAEVLEVHAPNTGTNSSTPPQQITPPYLTNPPLAVALKDYLGGIDNVNNYLDQVRDSYLRLIQRASALERFSRRYTPEVLGSLPPDEQTRIGRLAADYTEAVQSEAARYLGLVSPVLDAMIQRNNLPLSPEEPAAVDCARWQQPAEPTVEDLERFQAAFFRLFVANQVSVPVQLSAEALLNDSSRAWRAFRTQLKALCAP